MQHSQCLASNKSIRHEDIQKNVAHNQEKNQPIETDPEITKIMEEQRHQNNYYKQYEYAQRLKGKHEHNEGGNEKY